MITHGEVGAKIGLRLKEARINAGLSENELGCKVYATERSIRGYENGIIIPNLVMVCNLAKVLGVPVGWLLDGEEVAQPKWISVKERLPEDCKDVFVWAVYHEEYGKSWALREIDKYCKGVGWENTADPDVREVTHWMPLPEPPKEDAHD